MARRNLRDLDQLVEAMRFDELCLCTFDTSYVRWSFRADERAEVDRAYFACLRSALGLTESETLDLIRAFYFGDRPYPL